MVAVLAPHFSPVVLRLAVAADRDALTRLAALDGARPLRGDVLVAAYGGELRAALSLGDGHVVSDPFAPTAELIALLRTRADLLRGDAPRRRPRVPRILRRSPGALPAGG